MAVAYNEAGIKYNHNYRYNRDGDPEYALSVPTTGIPIDRRDWLWRRVLLDEAGTLIRQDGSWSLVRYPAQETLENAEAYYRGGYQNIVSGDHVTELIADGFGSSLTLI